MTIKPEEVTDAVVKELSRPIPSLMAAALRVLAYLASHKDVGLRYT